MKAKINSVLDNKLHVLGVDDHAVVLEGYHYMFRNLPGQYAINFVKANDGKSGVEVIMNHKDTPFDVALLDYSIPKYSEKNISSGKDLAVLVRKYMPGCKIIMLTMHREGTILSSILKQVNPEGFINKSDCTTDELCDAFSAVLNNGYYYSDTIKQFLSRRENKKVLEESDLRILILLAKGVEDKNLSNFLQLTEAEIQERKFRLKKQLNVRGDNAELIDEAKKQGYL